MTVPVPAAPEPAVDADIQLIPADKAKVRNDALLDLPKYTAEDEAEAHREERKMLASLRIEPVPEHTGQRQLPWPIDILLYPANLAGLTCLGVIIGGPVLLILLSLVLWVIPAMGLLSLLGHGLIALYAAWYFAECVYDSAQGGTRAPPALDTGGIGEMWSRVLYMLIVWAIFVLPMIVYFFVTGRRDTILWGLVAWAVLFFPIGLLAMVLNDSISALNPFFLIGSILRVFFPYMGLALLLAGIVVGSARLWPLSFELTVVGFVIGSYGMLILAHMLGRFYWRYRKRLDWGL
ncbi:MAG: hypothetical protein JW955_18340 [Sedimentisphaerales bacterium]|nr:hypothetical protein [Sedimentisphaerales bacterium]